MKKVLLISVCLIVSVLLGGGKSWASVTFSENGTTLTITLDGTASTDDNSSVSKKMENSNYTKVVVVGGTITDAFAQSIFYTQYNVNEKITSLDFSGTSYTSTTFAKSFFDHNKDNWRKGNLKVASLSLPSNITKIDDEAVQLGSLTEVVLPEGLTTIGKKAFMNTQLASITFPENLDKIDDAAFAFTKLHDFKFNSKLRYIGNSAFAWSESKMQESTITIPASVKYIGPAAFHFHKYQDVYFQGNRAPVMPYGKPVVSDISEVGNNHVETTAFYCQVLMGFGCSPLDNAGNGTADNPKIGWANRENYSNGGTYICVMHYPKTLTNEDDINTYVDVTRKYITTTFNSDGTTYAKEYKPGNETTAWSASNGTTSSYNYGAGYTEYGYQDTYLGEQYIWPSQNQMKRAYITAVNGVKWDGTTKYRTTLTNDEKAVLAEAGYTTENGYSEDDLQKMAHQGTRMFVLANNDAQTTPDYKPNITKDGTWWTICVPFNMTKKQVKETFGEKTKVSLFDEVTRKIDIDGKNHILIRFATNPMEKKTADSDGKKMKWDADENADQEDGHVAGEWKYSSINAESNGEPEDDDIVIWAHESYMIKPLQGENADKDPVTIVNLTPEPGNPLPTVVRAKTVRQTQDNGDYDDCYRFVGNYKADAKMPQYSYFYGAGANDKTEKFRFYIGTQSNWKANKSIIQASAHDGGAEDYQNFFGGNGNNAKVMQSTVFGFDEEDNSTTGIDDVKIVVGNDTLSPVFTLDGKLVNVSGDTTGLAKGVYVKAGKKFIVQ